MRFVGVMALVLLVMSCSGSDSGVPKKIGMPNPASVKCVEDGHKLEIRTGEGGGQIGICINAAGNECEEWAYFRGECQL